MKSAFFVSKELVLHVVMHTGKFNLHGVTILEESQALKERMIMSYHPS